MTDRGAAIVGTGWMGRVHAEALARIGIEVVGVVGSSSDRAAAAGLGAYYCSFEEMLDDPRVRSVHICSPNHLHHAQAMAAMRTGKHVICEKPLALTPAHASELVTAANDFGVVNAVCFINRFYPLCQQAADKIRHGDLGPTRLISGSYLQDWLSKDTDTNWRLDPERGGSLRAVSDIGSHWLDLASFITGQRVESVMADLTTALPDRSDTDDIAGALLRFDQGARGVLTVSQVSPGRKNQLAVEIAGADASLRWDLEHPEQLWIGHRDEPNQLELRGTGDQPIGHALGYPDAFKAFFRAVYDAIEADEPPQQPDYPTFADGFEQVLIADAIAESARLETWVPVQR
ncbi:Gfo/Idh/MocA family oxidoreductase [Mycolicibacterium rufum]|uniref:Gfo/Idh/MocA family oxidoreductase n=1 Tax=Mycolicibacterium rufum TaxID=318424 RepID=A0A9X2Y4W6_9MYCO|nr:Gfo/Idh/MocA family oxidoreductase [Mycolicibacterium rufum]KGI66844.1 dehydrogenase [Mycolicibacterium rufum]MCV7074011.1 Gfo/Idh/MocA family oxidoreductase [Mycolicibacterium rufum]ULP37662.1 Gfo/Idh/MocA family oxidoreductase [Mycolicibacterium rufum]